MLVSDGGDNSSTHGAEQVMQLVRESRATIYTIGIFDGDDPDRNPRLLRRLARVSGGESFFPGQLPEIIGICQKIAGRYPYTVRHRLCTRSTQRPRFVADNQGDRVHSQTATSW